MRKKDKAGRGLSAVLVTGLLVVGAVIVAGALGWMLLGKPFSTKTVDRSATPVLAEIRDLSDYHAAQGEFNVLVDVEKDVKYMPSAIAGERTLFIGVGTVDAFVDFSTLGTSAIEVSKDGTTVTVSLPAPILGNPIIDTRLSHVASRKRGLFNRIGGLFADSPTGEGELYRITEAKLADAAAASDLRDRAAANTERMLRDVLGRLGYDDVIVVFEKPAPGNDPGA